MSITSEQALYMIVFIFLVFLAIALTLFWILAKEAWERFKLWKGLRKELKARDDRNKDSRG